MGTAAASVGSPALWVGFILFVLAMLALDLGVFHRKTHAVTVREAAAWSAVWVGLALLFSLGTWTWLGREAGVLFLTGYVIEKSLSVDNIFVFVVIFGALGIPALYQHRVLYWGILSALVLRAAMILAGTALLARFHWLIYVLGAFLVVTGVKLFWQRDKEEDPGEGAVARLARRFIPSTPHLDGQRFLTRVDGRLVATPLLMALVLVETADVVFAVDSIPAIFAITTDPFLVFTSNIFAIMGLRSLYFLLAGMVERFTYLKAGLSAVLVFVGAKMVLVDVVKVPALVSLAVIGTLLAVTVVASWLRPRPTAPTRETAQPGLV